MRQSGQIKEVSLEQLAADPDNKPEGRFWQNTTSKDFKVILNNVVRKVFTSSDQITNANIADGTITTSKIKDGDITTAKIADGAITKAKLSAINMAISNAIPSYELANTTAGTTISVTGLSVSLTTTGRPVMLSLVHDPDLMGSEVGDISYLQASSGSTALLIFRRTTSGVNTYPLKNFVSHASIYNPSGAFNTTFTCPAGTHTFQVLLHLQSGGFVRISNCRLMAIEI